MSVPSRTTFAPRDRVPRQRRGLRTLAVGILSEAGLALLLGALSFLSAEAAAWLGR